MKSSKLSRREIIQAGLITMGALLFKGNALGFSGMMPPRHAAKSDTLPGSTVQNETVETSTVKNPEVVLSEERKICIYNLHTKERQESVFWRDGAYIESALNELDFIFRDHYNGAVRRIDKQLLDFLFAIQQKVGTDDPFQLISGYRSRRTNERLRKSNKAVSRKSMHLFGKAADIRLPSVGVKKLRRVAYELQKGGVGYYPRSNFVHVDVGRVRFWRG